MARGGVNRWIPRLCAALRRENPNYSNYDIREIVMKDCIEIWQKATIRDALPEEYKDKAKQQAAEESHKVRYGSGQTTEFDESDPNVRGKNLAQSDSLGLTEDVSETFEDMNRGQDVITESERVKKLEERLNEQETELDIVKKENNVLKEKTQPELLKEIQEKFYDQPGLVDAKKLHKISIESGKNLEIMLERYNSNTRRSG